MAKKNKKQSSSEAARTRAPRRRERRFVSQSATNPKAVYALAWVAALLIGAGAWAFFYAHSFGSDESGRPIPQYVLAGGIVLLGITVWIGTSSEPAIRVGAPGIALEKGELRRMPWWAVEKITFDSAARALVCTGKDESGSELTLKVPVKAHPEAAGWLVKEALDRIPRRVDIADETVENLPAAHEEGGQTIELEPLQVVGKRCAVTGKAISYEPDACVCPRCERVYLKRAVPKKCKCGNSLVHLRPKVDDASSTEDVESDAEDEEAPPTEAETETEAEASAEVAPRSSTGIKKAEETAES
jgi:hypothetical protein